MVRSDADRRARRGERDADQDRHTRTDKMTKDRAADVIPIDFTIGRQESEYDFNAGCQCAK
jgi:hypothetical protein